MSGKVIEVTFPTSARGKKKRVDTIMLDAPTLKKLRNPRFQRPFRMTPAVQAVVEEIKETGVFPGILTLGVLNTEVWVIDGQHRIEAVKISERGDVLADVHYLECDTEEEMADEFRRLNTALVKFTPDDLLRAREVSSLGLQKIRSACRFVGYDQIRRGPTSPVLSMSQCLRSWFMSEHEAPHSSGGVALLCDRVTVEEAEAMTGFLKLAYEAWGRETGYARLWTMLNMTLCMWLYRRLVLAPVNKTQRRTHLTRDQFASCLMSLSADSLYLDFLIGRKLNDDHRSPTYNRICQTFNRRLREQYDVRGVFPKPEWTHS